MRNSANLLSIAKENKGYNDFAFGQSVNVKNEFKTYKDNLNISTYGK